MKYIIYYIWNIIGSECDQIHLIVTNPNHLSPEHPQMILRDPKMLADYKSSIQKLI